MARNTKNNEQMNEGFQAPEYGTVETWEIERVRNNNGMIRFTLILNGVTINGCYLKEWKDGRTTKTFIGMPSYKGSDGNYYNHVYFRFSPEDQDAIIDAVYDAAEDIKRR